MYLLLEYYRIICLPTVAFGIVHIYIFINRYINFERLLYVLIVFVYKYLPFLTKLCIKITSNLKF